MNSLTPELATASTSGEALHETNREQIVTEATGRGGRSTETAAPATRELTQNICLPSDSVLARQILKIARTIGVAASERDLGARG